MRKYNNLLKMEMQIFAAENFELRTPGMFLKKNLPEIAFFF